MCEVWNTAVTLPAADCFLDRASLYARYYMYSPTAKARQTKMSLQTVSFVFYAELQPKDEIKEVVPQQLTLNSLYMLHENQLEHSLPLVNKIPI